MLVHVKDREDRSHFVNAHQVVDLYESAKEQSNEDEGTLLVEIVTTRSKLTVVVRAQHGLGDLAAEFNKAMRR